MKYETVIGLEIHAELSTKTKAFCACEYSFGGEVNTQCCPVCAAMPGALPVLNKAVIDYALKIGLATDCSINKTSKFDRKNYFYPDLPGAYQHTQDNIPICENGKMEFFHNGEKRVAKLNRIHMEEDTAKLLHMEGETLIDFNRCGVPLIEIVTEPDFRSKEEVRDFLEALRILLATLDICNCKMQEGAIRFDVNVSVRPFGQKVYGTRVEMKNVSSFSGAVLAIEYESNRQIQVLESGGTLRQETRRWDEQRNESVSMRTKETAADYRYFPEPNLLPLVVNDAWINDIKSTLPELPIAKLERYQSLGVPKAESLMLIEQTDKSAFFDECMYLGANPKNAAILVMGHITAILNKSGATIEETSITPKTLHETLQMVEKGEINLDAGKRVLDEIFETKESPKAIVQRLGLAQVSDEGELRQLVETILAANAKSIEDYKNGKSNAFAFLVGQCMKASKGKANPQVVNALIREMIEN